MPIWNSGDLEETDRLITFYIPVLALAAVALPVFFLLSRVPEAVRYVLEALCFLAIAGLYLHLVITAQRTVLFWMAMCCNLALPLMLAVASLRTGGDLGSHASILFILLLVAWVPSLVLGEVGGAALKRVQEQNFGATLLAGNQIPSVGSPIIIGIIGTLIFVGGGMSAGRIDVLTVTLGILFYLAVFGLISLANLLRKAHLTPRQPITVSGDFIRSWIGLMLGVLAVSAALAIFLPKNPLRLFGVIVSQSSNSSGRGPRGSQPNTTVPGTDGGSPRFGWRIRMPNRPQQNQPAAPKSQPQPAAEGRERANHPAPSGNPTNRTEPRPPAPNTPPRQPGVTDAGTPAPTDPRTTQPPSQEQPKPGANHAETPQPTASEKETNPQTNAKPPSDGTSPQPAPGKSTEQPSAAPPGGLTNSEPPVAEQPQPGMPPAPHPEDTQLQPVWGPSPGMDIHKFYAERPKTTPLPLPSSGQAQPESSTPTRLPQPGTQPLPELPKVPSNVQMPALPQPSGGQGGQSQPTGGPNPGMQPLPNPATRPSVGTPPTLPALPEGANGRNQPAPSLPRPTAGTQPAPQGTGEGSNPKPGQASEPQAGKGPATSSGQGSRATTQHTTETQRGKSTEKAAKQEKKPSPTPEKTTGKSSLREWRQRFADWWRNLLRLGREQKVLLAGALALLAVVIWMAVALGVLFWRRNRDRAKAIQEIFDAYRPFDDPFLLQPPLPADRLPQAAYQTFLAYLALCGFERAPQQTEFDFVRWLQANTPLTAQAVEEVTQYYSASQYSTHPLGEDDLAAMHAALLVLINEVTDHLSEKTMDTLMLNFRKAYAEREYLARHTRRRGRRAKVTG